MAMEIEKSAAAHGFGTDDAVTNVLETMASGSEPSFAKAETEKSAEQVDADVARRLARRYGMYKIAAICAVMDGKCGPSLNEDDLIVVSAAQDMLIR